jgi:hypothetical protein
MSYAGPRPPDHPQIEALWATYRALQSVGNLFERKASWGDQLPDVTGELRSIPFTSERLPRQIETLQNWCDRLYSALVSYGVEGLVENLRAVEASGAEVLRRTAELKDWGDWPSPEELESLDGVTVALRDLHRALRTMWAAYYKCRYETS